MKRIFINTCLFDIGMLSQAGAYIEKYSDRIGFEILPKFDMDGFEEELESCLPFFRNTVIAFHEPVFEADHAAMKGTELYDSTMYHIEKTLKYAEILHSTHLTMHLNNMAVPAGKKEEMLETSLKNIKEIQSLFAKINCPLYIENTGTKVQGNVLLDQQEFTDLCRRLQCDVLIDTGHANANGWDLKKLICDLKGQIRAYHLHNNDGCHDMHARIYNGTLDMKGLLDHMDLHTPDAEKIIEYIAKDKVPYLEEDLVSLLERY